MNKSTDPESERCIIAAMLESEESLIHCITGLAEDDFVEKIHQAAFNTLKSLYTRAIKPTFLEVLKEGMKTGTITTDQERHYLTQIQGYHVSVSSLPFWIKNVQEKTKLRKLNTLIASITFELDQTDNTDKLINRLQIKALELMTRTNEKGDTGAELADLGRRIFQENKMNKGKLLGITTGIGKLNRLTGGWKSGDLILLAAETGRGKTAFCQNFISHACFVHQVPTVYINSEMSRKQVITRFAAIASNVPAEKIKFGEQTQKDDLALEAAMKLIEQAPFYHYFMPALDLNKTTTTIRKEFLQHGIKFAVVDYVGRMEKTAEDLKEWQVLEIIVKSLKTLAQELGISIMILAQLNDDQRLQGAKRMENESDIFLKIAPMSQDEISSTARYCRITPNFKLVLKKNRDGESGLAVPVFFKKETLEIMDVANTS